MFVKDDNNKIINLLNHLYLIYLRFLKRKKIEYFYKYRYNVIKNGINQYQQFGFIIKKEKIYNKLFKESQKRELKLKDLEKKINEDESIKYPFTPKINHMVSIFYNDKINNIQKNSYSPRNNKIENKEKILKSFNDKNIIKPNHNRSYSISLNKLNQINDKYIPLTERVKNNSLSNIKAKLLNQENINTNYFKNKIPNIKKPKKKSKSKINSQSNSILINNKTNEKIINNNNNYNTTDIQNNLSSLFNSRLNYKNKSIDYNSEPISKIILKKFKQQSGEYSSNLYEKPTTYISDKQSRTEQMSSIQDINYKNNDNKKSKDYLYNLKSNSKIPYNNFYSLNYCPPQSNSSKSTYFISPRYESNTNKIILKGNRLIPGYNNNSHEYSGDNSKKNSTQNSRGKNSLNVEQFSGTSTGKNNNSNNNNNNYNNSNNNNNYNNRNNNNYNNHIINNNFGNHIISYNNSLQISNGVINEFFIDNNKINDYEIKNTNNSSNNNSNPITTLQTISDTKLFELANRYITTDESLEKFRYLSSNNPQKINKVNQNYHFNPMKKKI